jgi:hypothetical protein
MGHAYATRCVMMVWCECRVVWQTNGATPLLIASYHRHVECVRALLGGGAAINQAMVGCASSMARHPGDCVCGDVWETACLHGFAAGWVRQCGGWMCLYRPMEPHRCTFPASKGICRSLWLFWMPARPSRFECWGADHI